jgi:hypothetical protein
MYAQDKRTLNKITEKRIEPIVCGFTEELVEFLGQRRN